MSNDASPILQAVSDDRAPDNFHNLRILEAILFASDKPLSFDELARLMPKGVDLETLLIELKATYQHRGLVLEKTGKAYAFRTASDLAEYLTPFRQESRKLSRQANETLAIIAYHQPVTRAEIEDIRGVSLSRGILDTLIETGWIKISGRRQSPGRPVTYRTTDDFLDQFNLENIANLPGLDELKAAGFLDMNKADAPANASEDKAQATLELDTDESTKNPTYS